MLVYRFENSEGRGPYRHSGAMLAELEKLTNYDYYWASDRDRHPSPREDINAWDNVPFAKRDKYFFGFDSQAKAFAWFDAYERAWLAEKGYPIVTYEIDAEHVLFGKRQVAFKKHKATLFTSCGPAAAPSLEGLADIRVSFPRILLAPTGTSIPIL